MTNTSALDTDVSPQQETLLTNGLHPTGTFVGLKKEEINQSIPERFEKVVRMHPHRIAVKVDDQAVTYADLNMMANRVARAILEKRGREAEPIGLLVETSSALFAAMVGVLKAGKFFVLLDPLFPRARIAAVLSDSQAELVVTDRQNASLLQDAASNDCLRMEIESVDRAISGEDLKLSIGSEALAAVLYTSGSTGEPKGVVVDQRDFLHRIMLRTNENHASEQDRIAVLSSSTGNAITNGFLALLNGATLLPFDVRKYGVARLGSWLRDERISICAISSSLFRKLCETLTGLEEFRDLRVIRLRSEAVYRTDFDLYKRHFQPSCRFVTGISSSEAGQLTTYSLDHKSELAGAEVPLGYPVEDKQVLLLDDDGREAGINEVGEIVVRSCLLSPGYWRRPEVTEAKFKADPLGGDKRLYFTGDLALMLPDGCLVYKGRKDFRLKIRGYGVELGEIEKRLLNHPAIREAVVVTRRNDFREDHLVAYFTYRSPLPPSVSELRSFLTEKLPDYMIPAAFVALEAMPLTANGKVDRQTLPMPINRRPDLDTPYTAPRTSLEKDLTKIWGDVLGFNQVGIHDNFFDLGGHSLLATRVITRIHETFQVGLAPSQFFEAPTVSALADCICQVRAQQGAEVTLIERTSRDKPLPLSFTQKRLWYLDQLAPGSSAYNMVSAHRLTGRLDLTALEKGLNEIIRRHEILRTIFKDVDGEPYQVVLPSVTITIPLVDLRGIDSDTAQESEVRRCFNAEAQRSFDLGSGPLVRSILLQIRDEEYVLILAKHHIVYDGWCRGIIARELSALYEAFSAGNPSPLRELPIQYADFADWQLRYLQGELLEKQLGYWKKQLENVPALLLPTDRPRPSFQTGHGGRHYFTLSKTVSTGLRSLANQNGATLFMTLAAAYMTLLHRYTGQGNIAVGSPIAGRNRTELESLIGLFLNMLVLRVDLAGNLTFLELLARVREVCLAAYARQDLPFEKLVEELHPERSLSRNPLFQVTFGLQNTQKIPLELVGLKVSDLNLDPGTARFDLELLIEDEDSGLWGYANYNADLFEPETIKRIIGHFQVLLEGIVAKPEQQLSDLPLLTQVERHQLLVEWNDTKTDYPKHKCVHELFEEQVERTPEAMAVVFEDERLTYRELNQRANHLAHYLRGLGVRPEMLVGICMERSLEMVVALLGVLKVGGAYVPLDPEYPKERIEFVHQDTQVRTLLTQERLLKRLPQHAVSVLCLDRDWQQVAQNSAENCHCQVEARNLAYVMYTSGSTGRPKGAMITHRALVNHMHWLQTAFPLTATDRVAQKTPFSSDASVWEFYAPLLVGATLIVARPDGHRDPAYLIKLITERSVTILQLVPSLLRALLEEKDIASCRTLKRVFCGGEELSMELQKRFSSQLDAQLCNLYGPTEATIDATYCVGGGDENTGLVPIGRPISNTKCFILDADLQPLPFGVAGELYLEGDGLARGYYNRPDLTAERFIPSPFNEKPGARLYRTGDVARYCPDGNIEFLGRTDDQVKLRGFRIELGEIEWVLTQHPGVRDSVVVARENAAGDKQLVAYIVPMNGEDVGIHELRSFLQEKLSAYMVPSAFVFLDSLPLTPNGKVNRRALPEPDQAKSELEEGFVAPRNPVEQLLVNIWAEVLKTEQIGVCDKFFDLGGHSLKATQVMSRVRNTFQVDLPLRALFEDPTVASLAMRIMQSQTENPQSQVLAEIVTEVESLTDEEVQRLLTDQAGTSTRKILNE